jgi:hypothetical protein
MQTSGLVATFIVLFRMLATRLEKFSLLGPGSIFYMVDLTRESMDLTKPIFSVHTTKNPDSK